jgi:hypothetical protein
MIRSRVASVRSFARTGARQKSGQVSAVSRRVNEDAPASLRVMSAAQKSKAALPTPRLTPAMRHRACKEGIRSTGRIGALSIDFAAESAASLGVMPS